MADDDTIQAAMRVAPNRRQAAVELRGDRPEPRRTWVRSRATSAHRRDSGRARDVADQPHGRLDRQVAALKTARNVPHRKDVDLVHAGLNSSDREVPLAIKPFFHEFFSQKRHAFLIPK